MNILGTGEDFELGWAYFEAAKLINKMFDDYAIELHRIDLDHDERMYLFEARNEIRGAIAPVRQTQTWTQMRDLIKEGSLSKLKSASFAIRRFKPEEMLASSDLRELNDAIKRAVIAVLDSSLPPDLNAYLFGCLVRMSQAIDNYEYRGLIGLQDSFATYIGAVGTNVKTLEKEDPGLRQSLIEVATVANTVLSLATGVVGAWPHLISGVDHLIKLIGP